MAPCGRVRSRCPGPALLLLLALAARPAAGGLPPAGLAAAGGGPALAGQPAGPGAAGPRGARGGGGGSGSGWKLSEEAVCREDVVRLCSKHSWANNLAVLECLQDVREVRGRAGSGRAYPRRRTKSGAPRRPRPSAPPPPPLLSGASAARAAVSSLPRDFCYKNWGSCMQAGAGRASRPAPPPLWSFV